MIEDLQLRLATPKKELSESAQHLESIDTKRGSLLKEKDDLLEQKHDLLAEKDALTQQVETLQGTISQLDAAKESDLQAFQGQIETAENSINALNVQLAERNRASKDLTLVLQNSKAKDTSSLEIEQLNDTIPTQAVCLLESQQYGDSLQRDLEAVKNLLMIPQ